MTEKISVCIPTYKRADSLNNLLSAILSIQDSRINEIMISCTGDKSLSFNNDTLQLIEALKLQKNKIKIKNNSKGLISSKIWFKKNAQNEILLILDDDVILTKNYLDLVNHFKDKRIGAVSGTLQTPKNDHYKDWSKKPIKNPKIELINTINFNSDIVQIENKYQVYMLKTPQIYHCQCLVGSAMFIRKDLLKLDINYQNGACNFEEFDYTYNIFLAGYDLIYDSSRIVYHNRSLIGGMREYEKKKKENSNYFKTKWHKYDTNLVIAIDFDNTITQNSTYLKTGELNKTAKKYIKKIKQLGCTLILWTTREGKDLKEAKKLCKKWRLPFDYYNEYPLRPSQKKINVDMYIDDKCNASEIDWEKILQEITRRKNVLCSKTA